MAIHHWLTLALTEGIGPILARRIVFLAGSAETACTLDATALQTVEGIGTARATQVARSFRAARAAAEAELHRAAAAGITVICSDDLSYPPLLKTIPDPPLVLYVRGTLEPRDLNAIAIVGSRKCSFYGREQAERFGALLANAAFTVLSGGARGIDSAAHRGAIANPAGRTIAVLGCGIDVTYPPENGSLFEQIARQGAVLSEYPMGTPPAAENFPRRNRIVSGMSRGVLVIEADVRSGALITARQAGDDHGRPVLALPGRVDNALSAGPHQLIRDGATLVTNLEEIIDAIGPLPHDITQPSPEPASNSSEENATPAQPNTPSTEPSAFSAQQQQILDHIDHEPTTVDQLIDRTGLNAPVILRELTFLCLKSALRRLDGQTFTRPKKHI